MAAEQDLQTQKVIVKLSAEHERAICKEIQSLRICKFTFRKGTTVRRMRIKRPFLTLGLAVGSFLFTVPKVQATIRLPESCRMGSCWTTTLDSKEALRTNNLGTLYLVTKTTNVYPPDPAGPNYQAQDYESFVNFHGTDYLSDTSQSYVFCSQYIPSVLFESEDSYRVDRLAIFEAPFGYNRGAYQSYLATCHNLAGPDYFSLDVYVLLLKQGYTTDYVTRSEQFSVVSPLEMMQLNPEEF